MSDSSCFGKELARLRAESGYSLEEIAKLTRINLAVLRDLEVGEIESAGGATYARGHIRSIVRVLEADPTTLLHLFDEKQTPDTRPMIERLEENNATTVDRQKSSISPKFIATAASVAIGMAIIIPSGFALASKSAHKSSVKRVAASVTTPGKAKVATTLPTSTHSIVVTASSGPTWVSVNDSAGAIIFSGLLAQGRSQSFPSGGVSTIRVGNAGVAALVVDGKDLGSLGAIGEVKTITIAPAVTPAQG